MSRITGADAKSLMEAYGAVYTPQELTEEQVWEGVGEWVNALLEEGYDLSEYTWEDMYEAYITEYAGGSGTTPAPISNTPYQSRFARPKNAGTPQTYGGGRSQSVTVRPPVASLPSSAKKVTQYPQGVSTGVGGGNAGASRQPPAARPAAPAATPAARPAAPAATPAARPAAPATTPAAKAAPAAAAPSTAATGFKLAQQGVNLAAPKKPSLRSDIDDLKNMGTASRQRQGLTQSFDPFDVVLGHLIDEGYADTEESATAIMANMSEEWRQSIFEAQEARNNPEKYEAEQRKRKEKDKKQIAMNDPHTGINSPAFAAFMKQQGR